MNTVVIDEKVNSQPEPTGNRVALKVSHSDGMSQRFSLPEGKSTVGSSPSCQIRLIDASARPLQCLIVRNSQEIIVTRWAAGIRLNGLDFTTASLRNGDVLSIGQLRLELVESLTRHTPVTATELSPVELIDDVEAQVAAEVAESRIPVSIEETPDTRTISDADLARLHLANQQARRRFRRLVASLRELRVEAHELDQHVNVLTEQLQTAHKAQDQLTFELHQSQAIAAERESQFGEELDRAIAELTASYGKAEAAECELKSLQLRNHQLQEQIDSLSVEISQLREACANYEADKQRYEQKLTDREAQLAHLREQLAQLQQSFEASVADLQTQNQALQTQLNNAASEREREIAELQGSLEASVVELHEQNEDLRAQLAKVITERDRDVHEAREKLETSIQELRRQKEILQSELADRAAEHEQQITAIRQSREAILAESHVQLNELHNQLATRAAEREHQVAALQHELENAHEAVRIAENSGREPDSAIAELEVELATIRSERQQLANAKHRLSEQLEEAEKRSQLLEIDVRSINAEWQRAQTAVARLQDELLAAQVHAADLDAQLADSQSSSQIELAAECDRLAGELVLLQQQLDEREHALTAAHDERDELRTDLAFAQHEFHNCQERIAELEQQSPQFHDSLRAELASRDPLLAELRAELDRANQNTNENPSAGEARVTELVDALAVLEAKLTGELQLKEKQIGGLSEELDSHREQSLTEIASRDSQLANLTESLRLAQEKITGGSTELQKKVEDLNRQIQSIEEKATADLCIREERIAELARELHETQDQLADCAAQGERLSELYQQAQADLASRAVKLQEENVINDTITAEQPLAACERTLDPTHAPPSPIVDPRDDDDPRLVRALASLHVDGTPHSADQQQSEFQPTSFIDRYSHIFEEDETDKPSEPTATPATSQSAPDLHDIAGDDSAALEAYMANMMKRVRGEISSDTIVPPVPRDVDIEHPAPFSNPVERMNTLTQRVATPVDIESAEADVGLIDLHELKQSSQKPPLPTNLTAMRELANISARQAIAKHRKRRHFEGALSKLLVSGIAGSTAGYMLLTADDYLSPYFFAGCGVAVVSGYWGLKLLGILLEMIRDGINNECPMELSEDEDPLPIDGVSDPLHS